MADAPEVGQVYRDTYGDKHRRNLRTIKVVEVFPNGVSAVVLTASSGESPIRERTTSLMFHTLRNGYELISEGA